MYINCERSYVTTELGSLLMSSNENIPDSV